MGMEGALASEGPKLEGPKLSAQKVRNLLVKAGFGKALYSGYVYPRAGFWVSKLHVGRDEDQIIVEYKPAHTYRPRNRDERERDIAMEAKMLNQYHEALIAAGLQVTRVERSPGGRLAWLVVA
jgi:hypothetical protein